jgi:cardiolipin synthase
MSQESLSLTGESFFEGILARLESAKSSVQIESYIFSPGTLADRICAALSQLAQRGVRVELMIDQVGSPDFERHYSKDLRAAGVKCRYFNKVGVSLYRVLRGRLPFSKLFVVMNRRNHRKAFLIDGVELWLGSFNVSDNHLVEVSGKDTWRDIGVQVIDPDVETVSLAMRALYYRRVFPWWKFKLNKIIFNQGPGSGLVLRQIQKRRLQSAQKRIWIQNPYFAPIRLVFDLLIQKARQGVDVRIIVPKKNDIFFMKWISYYYFKKLIQSGIQVYEYVPTFSHQKIIQVDDQAFVGSINYNHRSFLFDHEIEVRIDEPENKRILEGRFLEELRDSNRLELRDIEVISPWERLLSRLFLLIRYWC